MAGSGRRPVNDRCDGARRDRAPVGAEDPLVREERNGRTTSADVFPDVSYRYDHGSESKY
jgi:hypothetical protein